MSLASLPLPPFLNDSRFYQGEEARGSGCGSGRPQQREGDVIWVLGSNRWIRYKVRRRVGTEQLEILRMDGGPDSGIVIKPARIQHGQQPIHFPHARVQMETSQTNRHAFDGMVVHPSFTISLEDDDYT
jgi:hypothetical protein